MYRTCIGCIRERQSCDARERVRKQLAGLGMTSIKWKCRVRVPRLVPGDPVTVKTIAYRPERVWCDDTGGYYDEPAPVDVTFPGHAIGTRGTTKMLVYIKPGAEGTGAGEPFEFEPTGNNNGYCKIPLSRLVLREGPRIEVCHYCERIVETMGHDEFCLLSTSGQDRVTKGVEDGKE